MKLSSSTGDFLGYVDTVGDAVRCFADTKFKYINLEFATRLPEWRMESDDGYLGLIEDLRVAAAEAGVDYVVAHAPLLNPYEGEDENGYSVAMRGLIRSMNAAARLGIPRIVVHAGTNRSFSKEEFWKKNDYFFRDLLDATEDSGVMVLIENMHDKDCYDFTFGREMCDFINKIGNKRLGACFDTAHCALNESARSVGQYENMVALGENLRGLHVSDVLLGCGHQHSWPFAGVINFDEVMSALCEVKYDGYFNFEASYTLLHHNNQPQKRKPWQRGDKLVTRLLDPSLELKRKAVDLLYDIGEYILESYDLFEE